MPAAIWEVRQSLLDNVDRARAVASRNLDVGDTARATAAAAIARDLAIAYKCLGPPR